MTTTPIRRVDESSTWAVCFTLLPEGHRYRSNFYATVVGGSLTEAVDAVVAVFGADAVLVSVNKSSRGTILIPGDHSA